MLVAECCAKSGDQCIIVQLTETPSNVIKWNFHVALDANLFEGVQHWIYAPHDVALLDLVGPVLNG